MFPERPVESGLYAGYSANPGVCPPVEQDRVNRMIILGLTRAAHDPSAALVIDGRIAAAAEEERFARVKHAPGRMPVSAARFCMESAGVDPRDVDIVAYPWSFEAYAANRWRFLLNHLRLPLSGIRAVARTGSRWKKEMKSIETMLSELGFMEGGPLIRFVPHHLSHAASAFHVSGMEQAAVLSMDAMGEFDSMLLGLGSESGIRVLKRYFLPQSLGTVYTAFTEYLGLGANDGEYKLMGMAPYGDPARADLSPIVAGKGRDFRVSPADVFGPSRYRDGAKYYSRLFREKFGPPRTGDGLSEPYIHIAAAVQKFVEETIESIVTGDLGPALRETGGNLCLAGGLALNVRANGRLLQVPGVKRVFVQPAANDAGGSLGAAVSAAFREGGRVAPMETAFLGPSFGEARISAMLATLGIPFRRPADLASETAALLAAGDPVARFEGAMEWGPRALGNRSILAHPGLPGTADLINRTIKFREAWRPFCPALLSGHAREILQSSHPCPWMTLSFHVAESWRKRLSQTVHVDGTARPQVVGKEDNPGLFGIIAAFERLTGIPAVLNTSFNLRGEPIVCTPEDAIRTFFASGLRHLAIGPFMVLKQGSMESADRGP